MVTMDTLAALGWSSCATGAGAASRVEAPAQLVAQHQNLAKRRTVLELLSQGYLAYSVPSDEKLLETSRGLGTGGPAASRHGPASSAREKEKARNRKRLKLSSSEREASVLTPALYTVYHPLPRQKLGPNNNMSRAIARTWYVVTAPSSGGPCTCSTRCATRQPVSTCCAT